MLKDKLIQRYSSKPTEFKNVQLLQSAELKSKSKIVEVMQKEKEKMMLKQKVRQRQAEKKASTARSRTISDEKQIATKIDKSYSEKKSQCQSNHQETPTMKNEDVTANENVRSLKVLRKEWRGWR